MATAERDTRIAFPELCAQALGRELGWLQRDLGKELKRVALGYSFLMDKDALTEQSYVLIRNFLLECADPLPVSQVTLNRTVRQARERASGIIYRYTDLLAEILESRDKVLQVSGGAVAWKMELDALVHRNFLKGLELSQLANYTRYLEALKVRIDRARQNPAKDVEKARQVIRFIQRFQAVKASTAEKRKIRWLLEEYKVQVFAQELGTAVKVSQKVVDAALADLEHQRGRKT